MRLLCQLILSLILACITLGGCVAVAPPSTVEVIVERADNGQPVQNALVEGSTGRSSRAIYFTAIGAPDYVAAYTDERGRASVRVFTGPAVMGNSSCISITTPGFYHASCWFDDEPRGEGVSYENGVLYVKLTTFDAKPGPRLSPKELRATPFIVSRARTRLEENAASDQTRPQVVSPCKACPCPDCGCGPNCSCVKTAEP